jgi:hypothetical protein
VATQISLFPGRSGIYILHSDAGTECAARTEVQQAAAAADLALLPYGRGSFESDRCRVYYWLAERRCAAEGAATVSG